MLALSVLVAGCSPGSGPSASPDASPAAGLDAAPAPDQRLLLRIEQPDGTPDARIVLEARAELARTEDERRRGLRGHAPLAPGEALLIELPFELDGICVVNDGVTFDIDAVFVRTDGVVTAIERLIPAGDPTARCHDRTRWIVETAAAQARDVEPGDRLIIDLTP
jgi:uncharacterized membrane protein (UPF0127 family)